MPYRAIAALAGTPSPHVGLGKSRLETLCLIAVDAVSARTMNLGQIACERPWAAKIASTCRRLQRFFQHLALGTGVIGGLSTYSSLVFGTVRFAEASEQGALAAVIDVVLSVVLGFGAVLLGLRVGGAPREG